MYARHIYIYTHVIYVFFMRELGIRSLDVHVYSFSIDVMFLCKKFPGLEVGLDLGGEQVGVGEL